MSGIVVAIGLGAIGSIGYACAPDAENQNDESTTQVVGSEGGAIRIGEVVLDIPAGALSSPQTITITRTQDVAPYAYTPLSSIYRFAPEGLVFAKPVAVRFAGTGPRATVVWTRDSNAFEPLATTLDAAGAHATTTHFSRGFLATPACEHATSCSVEGAKCGSFEAVCDGSHEKERRNDCECAGAAWKCTATERECPGVDAGSSDAGSSLDASTDAADAAIPPGCATTFSVSPDLAIPSTSSGNAQVAPAVAFDGTNYLLLWGEGPSPGTNWVVKATRISATGTVLDNPPLTVSGGNSVDARAAFDGTDFVVVWSTGPYGGGSGIAGARVSPAGTLRPGSAFTLPGTADCYNPDVVCGVGQCLVGWNNQGSTQVEASRVASNATVLDNPPLLLATVPATPGLTPRIQFDGVAYDVAWGDTTVDGGVYSRPVSTSGQASSTSTVASRPFLSVGHAFDGEEHLLVWSTQGGGGLQGLFSRVSKDGGVLDPKGRLLADAGSYAERPTVAFDGREFVSVWGDSDGGTTGRLLGVRICGGVPATPFTVVDPITSPSRESFFTEMASDSKGHSLVAYTLCGGGIDCRVHARLVSAQ
jgi:hypothetical protein